MWRKAWRKDRVDFKACSVRTIFKKELNFPNHLSLLQWKFIHSSLHLELIICLATHGEKLSWSWTALNVYKREKILAMIFLLSCQEHTKAFKNVIAQLSTYPRRLFSTVRKEYTVPHSSYLTLFNHRRSKTPEKKWWVPTEHYSNFSITEKPKESQKVERQHPFCAYSGSN